jgi:molecular chaperone DnaK (HSP70)
MVEESVEHAFEDMAARRWVETKLKANQLISATRKGIAACAPELDEQYQSIVQSALRDVETALATEHAEAPGEVRKLQATCEKLDEVTKPLADLLMEKATDAWLRKKGVI